MPRRGSGALAAPGAASRTWKLAFGDSPGDQAMSVAVIEFHQHAWDIARATGQDVDFDPSVTAAARASAEALIAAFGRQGNVFKPEVPCPDDAPAEDCLAAFSVARCERDSGAGALGHHVAARPRCVRREGRRRLQTTPFCRSLSARSDLAGLTLIATNDGGGRVDVIIVSAGPIATAAGIHIGSSRADVLAAYGDQVTTVSDRRMVYRPRDAALRDWALAFTIADGKVTSMYAVTQRLAVADEFCA